jgi:molybdopterin-containing oxidoreductase family membrane subunit
MIVAVALRKVGYLAWDQANLVKLGKLLAAFILVDLYFFGCDLLTAAFPQSSGLEVFEMLTTGVLAPFFWTEVVLCAVAAIICLVPSLRTTPLLVTAAVFAIIGILCKRIQLLDGGFQIANITNASALTSASHSSFESGMEGIYSSLVYMPTALELGVALGVTALAVLVFLLGIKFLPLRDQSSK